MSVEDPNVIDFVAAKPATNRIELVISDHLEWSEEQEESHIRSLQRKINRYMDFIRGGELEDRYEIDGKTVVIRIVAKHAPSARATEFINYARGFVVQAGAELELAHLASA